MPPLTNYFWVAFVLWPITVQLSALCNMAIWAEFSGWELIIDWFVGVGLGSCFWLFTSVERADRAWWRSGLMVFSHGIFGFLGMTSLFGSTRSLFWWTAGSTVVATILAASLDHAAVSIGGEMTAGGVVLSIFIFLLKAPFCLVSTVIGFFIFIAGAINTGVSSNAKVGFNGGVLYSEWNRVPANQFGTQATTVGATVHCWKLRFCQNMRHELYHTRQNIYMRDLMIPTWCIGFVITGGKAGQENPIEHAAYKVSTGGSKVLPAGAPCTP
jgi:hypothetical protein